MKVKFSEYNYTPLLNLAKSDFIDLKSNFEFYIPFGDDNLLPTQLNKLSREVPVHRAILNAKANYITGKGLASSNKILGRWIRKPNNSNDNLNVIIKKIIFDYLNLGNAFLEIVTDKNKSFLFLYHIDASKVRFATSSENCWIHPDWEQLKGKNDPNLTALPLYPYFAMGDDGLFHAVFHIKDYEPEFYFYGLPAYFPGLRSIIISGLVNVWNQTRLERQFNSPGLLIIPGVNDPAEAEALDAEFQKYKGIDGEKAADIIIQYLSDLAPGQASQAAQYVQFKKDNEGNWLDLHKQAEASLITIHNWFRTLTPYSDDKSGFDKNRIISEYEVAMSSVIRPHQEMFAQQLSRILSDFDLPTDDLEFINEPPVNLINPFKFVWEARRDSGLDYDKTDPLQRQLVAQVKNTFTTTNHNQNE